jgi:TonB family protein
MRALLVSIALVLAPVAGAGDRKAEPQTRQLRVLQQVMPAYHRIPGAQEGGCVTVQFVIKYDGFVGDVKVLEARPPELGEPTVAALKQWQFQSFPPPDLQAVQTFNFAPDQVRMPDSYVRSPLAALGDDGRLDNQGCGGKGG